MKRTNLFLQLILISLLLITAAISLFIYLKPIIALFISALIATTLFLFFKIISERNKNTFQNQINDYAETLNSNKDISPGKSMIFDSSFLSISTYVEDLRSEFVVTKIEAERLRQAFEKIKIGLIFMDQENNILYINRGAKKILEPIKSNSGSRAITLSKNILDIANKANGGQKQIEKFQLAHSLRTVEAIAIPLSNGDSKNGCLISLQDITELDALADVKKDFIANVSHDLRTPITSIRSLTDALIAGAKDDPKKLNSFLTELDQQAMRLFTIARDILDLSRIENENLTSFEYIKIAPLLKQSVSSFRKSAEDKNISIGVNLDENIKADVDPEQLMKAFNNLLDNSIKYTSGGGNISITMINENNCVSIHFKDSGIGISQKDQARIFERFYRVNKSRSIKSGGSGLGLAIVKHVVENHKGQVKVISQLNQGSEFIISLAKKR